MNEVESRSIVASPAEGMAMVEMIGVSKRYGSGVGACEALSDVSLTIARGTFAVVRGPSGSGKSTLLNILGAIDLPTSGRVVVAGQELSGLSDRRRTAYRADSVGFIFQNFNLLPMLTALENVEYPLRLSIPGRRRRREMALAALEAVGLAAEANRRPVHLSGGQQQRVAVARALVKEPSVVLADEPTANLDEENAMTLVAQMRSLQRKLGTTFILSSHDPRVLTADDAVFHLRKGRLESSNAP